MCALAVCSGLGGGCEEVGAARGGPCGGGGMGWSSRFPGRPGLTQQPGAEVVTVLAGEPGAAAQAVRALRFCQRGVWEEDS